MEPKISHVDGTYGRAQQRCFEPGERIFKAGERYQHFYVIGAGEVLVAYDRGEPNKPSEPFITGSAIPGERVARVIGVRDYFEVRPSRYDYVAVSRVVAYQIDSPLIIAKRDANELDPLVRLLALDPDFGLVLLRPLVAKSGIRLPPTDDPRQIIKLIEAFNAGGFARGYMKTLSDLVYALLKRRNNLTIRIKREDPDAEEPSMVFDSNPLGKSVISG